MFTLLNQLDFFKTPLPFYFDGKTQRSSREGLCISIMIIVFLIYQFSNSDLFMKTSPIVVLQSLQTPHSPRISFNDNTPFIMAIADRVYIKPIVDPTIFTLSVYYFNYYETETPINMPVAPCTYDDLPYNHTYFDTMGMGKMYCLKNKTFYLEGYGDEANYSMLTVSVYPCYNETSNFTCKSQEEIDAFFRNTLISVGHHNTQVNVNDYLSPFKTTFNPVGYTLDPSLSKNNLYYIKTVELHTDDGWIFPNDNIMVDFTYDKYYLDFAIRTSQKEPLMKWYFWASKEKVYCNRKYEKLPEALAALAGISHLFLFIFFLYVSMVTHLSSMKYVLNKLYYVESFDKKPKKKKKEKNNNNKNDKNSKKNMRKNMKNFEKSNEKGENIKNCINIEKNQELHVKIDEPRVTITTENLEQIPKIPSKVIEKYLKDDSFILENYSQAFITTQNTLPCLSSLNFNELFPKIHGFSQEIDSNMKISNNNDKNTIIPIKSTENNEIHKIIIPENEKIVKTKKFSLSIFEYLSYFIRRLVFCKKTEREKIIEKAEKKYKKELDILNIMSKHHEIENLKLLLFDKEQLILFNYFSKPFISTNEKMKENPYQKMLKYAKSKKINNYWLKAMRNAKKVKNQIS